MEKEEMEKIYNIIWQDVVENEDGSLNLEEIKSLLYEYWKCLQGEDMVPCQNEIYVASNSLEEIEEICGCKFTDDIHNIHIKSMFDGSGGIFRISKKLSSHRGE